jgi:hypothetical protein
MECIRFNPFETTPEILPHLKKRTEYHVVGFKEYLYVIGGCDTESICNYVERLNVSEPGVVSRQWEFGPCLQRPRSDFGCCVYKDNLYVFGGKNLNPDFLKDVPLHEDEGYNQYASAILLGHNLLRSVEVLDRDGKEWEVQDHLAKVFGYCCACVVGDEQESKIWIAEQDYDEKRFHVDEYDGSRWTKPPMIIRRMKNITHMLALTGTKILILSRSWDNKWIQVFDMKEKVFIDYNETGELQKHTFWKDMIVLSE